MFEVSVGEWWNVVWIFIGAIALVIALRIYVYHTMDKG